MWHGARFTAAAPCKQNRRTISGMDLTFIQSKQIGENTFLISLLDHLDIRKALQTLSKVCKGLVTHPTPGAARVSVSCLLMPVKCCRKFQLLRRSDVPMSPAQLQPSVTRSPASDDGKVAPQTDKICADGPCRAFYSTYTHRRFCRENYKGQRQTHANYR